MRILVTGGAGYLGSELRRQLPDALATWHRTPLAGGIRLDVRDDEAVHRVLLKHGPDVVIHAAYVMGDAETITRGSRNVALAAHRVDARLIHLSTDLVFDGEHGAPYAEDAEPRPVSEYGQAKLEAEALVHSHHPDALVVRTSLLYGRPGPQEALAQRDDVVYHTDEIRCPTRVDELAAALLELATRDETGILHVAAPDAVSRYELARLLGARDPPGAPTPPGRPRNVALDSTRAAALLATKLRGVNAATLG
jgi:dTDP-4-dehydrorhamnose reductase